MKLLEKLPEDARQVKGSLNWVDPRGNLYGMETRKSRTDILLNLFRTKTMGNISNIILSQIGRMVMCMEI